MKTIAPWMILAGLLALPAAHVAAAPALPAARTLILVELRGGIDGLDAVIPYADPQYQKIRPTLAVPRDQVLDLDGSLGVHPALAPLSAAWAARQLAIVLGVGYPNPDLSHFRSIDIWETGSGSGQVLTEGWLASALGEARQPPGLFADGVVIGDLRPGPLDGGNLRVIALNDPRQFLSESAAMGDLGCECDGDETPAVSHIMQVRMETKVAATTLGQVLPHAPTLQTAFPDTPVGRQARTAATLLAAGLRVPVIKLTLPGFDLHVDEKAHQEKLLGDLAAALAALRTELASRGLWDNVLVMTYSEFGRRAAENASGGTDHGTAEPILLMGGQVKGGLYGKEPPLSDLDNGNLRATTDYRSVYATVAQDWLGVSASFLAGGPWPSIPFLRVTASGLLSSGPGPSS